MASASLESLEEKIGYRFSNRQLLEEALTHPSVAYETRGPRFDNQRLEYLGDAVIQLAFTSELYARFPEREEGPLTKLRSRLVSKEALSRFARVIGLGAYLRLGKGEESSGGRRRDSNLADAFEAMVGAVFLDRGFKAAQGVLLENFASYLEEAAAKPEDNNPKGELQEILQAINPTSPVYEIVSQEGPDHERNFVARVLWREQELGKGSGQSKKEAETAAANDALKAKAWEK